MISFSYVTTMWNVIFGLMNMMDVILLLLAVSLLPLFMSHVILAAKQRQELLRISEIVLLERERLEKEQINVKQQLLDEQELQRQRELEYLENRREKEEQMERERRLEEKRNELEKRRQMTIQEMLNTEETYLNQLKILNDVFIEPVRDRNLASSQKVFDMIFPVDIQIITRMNSNFCNQLKRIIQFSRRSETKRTTNDLKDNQIEKLQRQIMFAELQMTTNREQASVCSNKQQEQRQHHRSTSLSTDLGSTNSSSSSSTSSFSNSDSRDSFSFMDMDMDELMLTEEEDSVDNFKLDPTKGQVTNLASLFLHYAPAFKLYVGFISKYGKCIEALTKECEKNKKLASFIEDQRLVLMDRNENSMIHDYLVTMVQRIPRYRLLLEDLLKNTEDDHEGKSSLIAATKFISDTAKFCNEKDRETEMQMQMFKLQRKLSLKAPFRNHSRKLIEQYLQNSDDPKSMGKMQYIRTSKKDAVANCDFYIFNDAIVFERKKSGLLKKSETKIQYIRVYMTTHYGVVTDVQVVPIDDNNNTLYDNRAFKVITTYKSSEGGKASVTEMGFVCETPEARSHIIEVLNSLKSR